MAATKSNKNGDKVTDIRDIFGEESNSGYDMILPVEVILSEKHDGSEFNFVR